MQYCFKIVCDNFVICQIHLLKNVCDKCHYFVALCLFKIYVYLITVHNYNILSEKKNI